MGNRRRKGANIPLSFFGSGGTFSDRWIDEDMWVILRGDFEDEASAAFEGPGGAILRVFRGKPGGQAQREFLLMRHNGDGTRTPILVEDLQYLLALAMGLNALKPISEAEEEKPRVLLH